MLRQRVHPVARFKSSVIVTTKCQKLGYSISLLKKKLCKFMQCVSQGQANYHESAREI